MNLEQKKFSELNLSAETLQSLTEIGFEFATQIQAESIPVIMSGVDMIGQAQTGTGKTAAFGIPMLEMPEMKSKKISALVLCPTRELAVQIANELRKMSKYHKGVRVEAIYGGESITNQIKALRMNPQIIVGTPGRVMDHMERRTISFADVKMVVLDEADEMLNMGFKEDIETILSDTPEEKQIALFSATMAKPIMDITRTFLHKPQHVKVVSQNLTANTIEQCYFDTGKNKKEILISAIIDANEIKSCLIFSNTKRKVDEIVEEMRIMGHKAEALHGDLSQAQRTQVMTRFRRQLCTMLVATDVAARGLDVNDVDAVFNYDLPLDIEYYVHRIGRTGRAGKSGLAYSFAETRKDLYRIKDLEKYIKTTIPRQKLPSAAELQKKSIDRMVEQFSQMINEADLETYETMALDIVKEGITMHELAACLLKKTFDKGKAPIAVVEETENKRDSRGSRGERGERNDRRERGDRNDRGTRSDRRERGERPERGERKPREERRTMDSKVIKMKIQLGARDRVRPADIVGAITGECKLSSKEIGEISIYDSFSFVEITETEVGKVLKAMKNNTIKGKKVYMQIANN